MNKSNDEAVQRSTIFGVEITLKLRATDDLAKLLVKEQNLIETLAEVRDKIKEQLNYVAALHKKDHPQ